jgi:hypothetical protein
MIVHSLKIPVSEYEHQLLTVMLGASPYKASYKNAIGKIILASYHNGEKKFSLKNNQSPRYYEIIIPTSWVVRHGVTFINPESIQDFIDTIDRTFKRELYAYIEGVLDFKENHNKLNSNKIVAKMKDAACRFLEKKGFNEDLLKFETVKKGYQRYTGQSKTIGRVA